MRRKSYVSLTGIQYVFPVKVGEEKNIVWIEFRGDNNVYQTSDKDIQKAIEATEKFKSKAIGLLNCDEEEPGKNPAVAPPPVLPKEYPEVTNISEAIEVLNKDYKVDKRTILTPEKAVAKAKELNAVFPNLKI
jgi:hypothetical protein